NWIDFITQNDVIVDGFLATPTTTPLTAAEVQEMLGTAHGYYPTTTIWDDAGCWQEAGLPTANLMDAQDIIKSWSDDKYVKPETGIPASDLADNAVETSKIKDGAVTTSKIPDYAITTMKIANKGVTNAKLGDGAVNNVKISNGSVSVNKMASYSTSVDIAVTDWSELTKVITVSGCKATDTVFVSSLSTDAEKYDYYISAGVYASAIADGQITMKCKKLPKGTVTVQIFGLHQEVTA
ncbi:MAG: hypothetical protein HUJ67_01460, partial [Ruminiclostridium sp.]|nr:hypothetical protein [Ruminiclostridium sp.]